MDEIQRHLELDQKAVLNPMAALACVMKNAHILACMLRFFIPRRLALESNPTF
jgi:hypothetical protein